MEQSVGSMLVGELAYTKRASNLKLVDGVESGREP